MAAAKKFVLKLPPLWQRPEVAADQYRFITCPKRIAVAATGTKTGKTLGCAEWLVANAGSKPRTLWWWVAPSHYQAKIGFERAKSLLPRDKIKVNETEKTILLPNGSMMEFRTGENPNLLYGAAVHGCVLDEAARLKLAVWEAIQTTMTQTMGPIRIATNTDKGKRNWVYPLYVRGLDPTDPEVQSFSIKTYDNPFISPESIEQLRRNLPRSAYEALVEAVFPEDALNVFRNVGAVFRKDYFPPFRLPVIRAPIHNHQYAAGLDLAKYTDFTVLSILDLHTKPVELVYWMRMNQRSWHAQIDIVKKAVAGYFNCPVVVDSTGVGDPIFEQLRMAGVKATPYQFTSSTKQKLIDKLALGVENAELVIPFDPQMDVLRGELDAFEYEISEHGNISFAAPDEQGIHDDAVISLALAWWVAANPFAVGYQSASSLRRNARETTGKRSIWQRVRGY